MNEISYNLLSSTMSQVVIAGLLSMQLLSGTPENKTDQLSPLQLTQASYSSDANPATFDSFRESVSGQYDFMPIQFAQSIGNFYSRLVSTQEQLGAGFEKVLHDNLWDLYES